MRNYCDLHVHSVFSDGTWTPAQIVDGAVATGLDAVALCDHNTVDGLPAFFAAGENKKIQLIPGAEFSVDMDGKELHLLGLFIPCRYRSQIAELMEVVCRRKEQSNIELVDSLNKSGYLIGYEQIKKQTPNGKVNRAHIARALTEKGYTQTVKHAFDTLLSPEAGHYKEPQRLTFWEMLDIIISINAVPVLAHPFLNLTRDELVEFLPKAKKRGLVGMECYYSLYSDEETSEAQDMAAAYGLMPSGGSDFHGETKPDIQLGRGKGNLRIPYEWAKALETCRRI